MGVKTPQPMPPIEPGNEPMSSPAPPPKRPEGIRTDEDNWSYCRRLVDQLDKDKLIGSLIRYIDRNRRRSDRTLPLWSLIGDATTHGSGVSSAIVARYENCGKVSR